MTTLASYSEGTLAP